MSTSIATKRLRPIGHDERLGLVDHLDELRFRLMIAASAFGAAFAFCLWKDDWLLGIVHRPLQGREPVTLGVAEPFTTTVSVAGYAGILLALPVLLWQVYAFILPAISRQERRVALPLMLLVPVLFIIGVVFAYYIVIPAALSFLLNFNADQFQTEIRAREYYGFVGQTLLALGLVFQVPVGILALTRLGIVTPAWLRQQRRYAVLGCAVVAMLLPGIDPVTMLIETIPLVALYELSILLAALAERVAGSARGAGPSEA